MCLKCIKQWWNRLTSKPPDDRQNPKPATNLTVTVTRSEA